MKILVTSDTHGYIEPITKYLKENKVDLLIHAGDYSRDCEEISKIAKVRSVCVKGNNDYSDYKNPYSKVIYIENYKILITHGHKENIDFTYHNLYKKALECKCQLAIFGHTHLYFEKKIGDILLLNPGSPSLPRDGKGSFAIIDINEGIKIERILIS